MRSVCSAGCAWTGSTVASAAESDPAMNCERDHGVMAASYPRRRAVTPQGRRRPPSYYLRKKPARIVMAITYHAALSERLSLYSRNKLKLGVFGPNMSSGIALTKVPERWSGSWEDNLRLAQLLDEAGIEFMLPVARWKGNQGATNPQEATLETITWACGLLAQTKRITVFGTVHVPLVHPVFAAKQFVTADHISRGRFGLNIVAGWNQDEFDMFGIEQREHDIRYEYSAEWLSVVRQLWEREDTFDFEGRFLRLKGLQAQPKPYGGTRPVMMNAGGSVTGRAFATKHCDFLFATIRTLEQSEAEIRDARERASWDAKTSSASSRPRASSVARGNAKRRNSSVTTPRNRPTSMRCATCSRSPTARRASVPRSMSECASGSRQATAAIRSSAIPIASPPNS